jgi:hypothetical protein
MEQWNNWQIETNWFTSPPGIQLVLLIHEAFSENGSSLSSHAVFSNPFSYIKKKLQWYILGSLS